MKRKVALLLALVMVVSMLPIKAFGAGPVWSLEIPVTGWNVFHLDIPIATFGQRNMAPGALGNIISPLTQNTPAGVHTYTQAPTGDGGELNPANPSFLFPVSLSGARLVGPDNPATNLRNNLTANQRRFIPTGPADGPNPATQTTRVLSDTSFTIPTGRAALFLQGSVLVGAHPTNPTHTVIPNGWVFNFGVHGNFALEVQNNEVVAIATPAAVTPAPTPQAVTDQVARVFSPSNSIVINPGETSPPLAQDSLYVNNTGAPLSVSLGARTMLPVPPAGAGIPRDHLALVPNTPAPASVLIAPTEFIEEPAGDGRLPALGPRNAAPARFTMNEWRRVVAIDGFGQPNTGFGVFDFRFIPSFNNVSNEWSNTEGWIDVRLSPEWTATRPGRSTFAPQNNGFIRIPFAVWVDSETATINVQRFDGGPNLRVGEQLFGGPQSLFGLVGDVALPGHFMRLSTTVAPFSSVLGLNSLTLSETFSDRIRNLDDHPNPLGLPSFPIFQALELRYIPFLTQTTQDWNTPTWVGSPRAGLGITTVVGRVGWWHNNVQVSVTTPAGQGISWIPVQFPPNTPGELMPDGTRRFPAGVIPFDGLDRNQINWTLPFHGMTGDFAQNLGWYTMRLEAPQYYTWWHAGIGGIQGFPHTGPNSALVQPFQIRAPLGNTAFNLSAINGLNFVGTGAGNGHNRNMRFEGEGPDQRHVLYIRVNAGQMPNIGHRNHNQMLAVLLFDGLFLFPTAQAPTSGEVWIHAEWGWSSRMGGNPWDAYQRVRDLTPQSGNLLVGRRGTASVNVGIVGDEPPNLRTGWLGDRVIGSNPGNNNIDHYRGQVTARVRIEESVAGILTTGWSAPMEFRFNQSLYEEFGRRGVNVLGARIIAGTNSPAHNNISQGTWTGWLDASDLRFAAGITHVQVSPGLVHVSLPTMGAVNINHPLRFDIEFYLSVEADYEHKFHTDEIWVEISGHGSTSIAPEDRSVLVGHAVDPIEVILDGDITVVDTDIMFGVASQRLSDVRVRLYDQVAVQNYSEIWLYLIDEHGAQTEFHLDANRVNVNVESSSVNNWGMVLAPPRTLTHPHASFQRHGVALTVERQPAGVPAGEYIDIVFSDIYITGRLLRDRNYMVAISGTRIAQNDQVVQVAERSGEAGLGATIPALNAGTFTALPYARPILQEGVGAIPEGPAGVFETGNSLALREGMLPVDTNVSGDFQRVEDPFWLWTNPMAPQYVVSMLNPRVFADFINGELDFNNGVVSFSGFDTNGNLVEVELVTGSTNATVNGQQVDIAAFAGSSGPNGSIQTMNRNDRTFVPLRFLANAFLLDIRFQDGTVFLER